ncbi:MAG: 5-(carboxyamino)imidazole ribonucleotide mutase [Thermoplasmata archaeon]
MSVLVVLGSKSDKKVGDKAVDILNQFGLDSRMIVASAHRSPDYMRSEIEKSDAKVIIAVAGLSAALPGAVASQTTRPVIGVPVSGKISLDSLLSIVQMPPGIPVAAVGLDRGENAALLAVEILALSDDQLREKLKRHREKLKEWILEDSRSIGD